MANWRQMFREQLAWQKQQPKVQPRKVVNRYYWDPGSESYQESGGRRGFTVARQPGGRSADELVGELIDQARRPSLTFGEYGPTPNLSGLQSPRDEYTDVDPFTVAVEDILKNAITLPGPTQTRLRDDIMRAFAGRGDRPISDVRNDPVDYSPLQEIFEKSNPYGNRRTPKTIGDAMNALARSQFATWYKTAKEYENRTGGNFLDAFQDAYLGYTESLLKPPEKFGAEPMFGAINARYTLSAVENAQYKDILNHALGENAPGYEDADVEPFGTPAVGPNMLKWGSNVKPGLYGAIRSGKTLGRFQDVDADDFALQELERIVRSHSGLTTTTRNTSFQLFYNSRWITASSYTTDVVREPGTARGFTKESLGIGSTGQLPLWPEMFKFSPENPSGQREMFRYGTQLGSAIPEGEQLERMKYLDEIRRSGAMEVLTRTQADYTTYRGMFGAHPVFFSPRRTYPKGFIGDVLSTNLLATADWYGQAGKDRREPITGQPLGIFGGSVAQQRSIADVSRQMRMFEGTEHDPYSGMAGQPAFYPPPSQEGDRPVSSRDQIKLQRWLGWRGRINRSSEPQSLGTDLSRWQVLARGEEELLSLGGGVPMQLAASQEIMSLGFLQKNAVQGIRTAWKEQLERGGKLSEPLRSFKLSDPPRSFWQDREWQGSATPPGSRGLELQREARQESWWGFASYGADLAKKAQFALSESNRSYSMGMRGNTALMNRDWNAALSEDETRWYEQQAERSSYEDAFLTPLGPTFNTYPSDLSAIRERRMQYIQSRLKAEAPIDTVLGAGFRLLDILPKPLVRYGIGAAASAFGAITGNIPAQNLGHYLLGSGKTRQLSFSQAEMTEEYLALKAKEPQMWAGADISVARRTISAGSSQEVGWGPEGTIWRIGGSELFQMGGTMPSSVHSSVGAYYARRTSPTEFEGRDWYDWHPADTGQWSTQDINRSNIGVRLPSAGKDYVSKKYPIGYFTGDLGGTIGVADQLWPDLGGKPFLSQFRIKAEAPGDIITDPRRVGEINKYFHSRKAGAYDRRTSSIYINEGFRFSEPLPYPEGYSGVSSTLAVFMKSFERSNIIKHEMGHHIFGNTLSTEDKGVFAKLVGQDILAGRTILTPRDVYGLDNEAFQKAEMMLDYAPDVYKGLASKLANEEFARTFSLLNSPPMLEDIGLGERVDFMSRVKPSLISGYRSPPDLWSVFRDRLVGIKAEAPVSGARNLSSFAMNYSYRQGGSWGAAWPQGEGPDTTLDAIISGRRTGTTRWNERDIASMQRLGVGDYIEAFAGSRSVLAEITKAAYPLSAKDMLSKENWMNRWSQLEGWTPEWGRQAFRRGDAYQMQYSYQPFRNIFVSGSRDASPNMLASLDEQIEAIARKSAEDKIPRRMIVGDAPGVDAQAIAQAEYYGVPVAVIGAQGRLRNRSSTGLNLVYPGSYSERDTVMSRLANVGWAFWNEESRGTAANISRLREWGKPTAVWGAQGQRLRAEAPSRDPFEDPFIDPAARHSNEDPYRFYPGNTMRAGPPPNWIEETAYIPGKEYVPGPKRVRKQPSAPPENFGGVGTPDEPPTPPIPPVPPGIPEWEQPDWFKKSPVHQKVWAGLASRQSQLIVAPTGWGKTSLLQMAAGREYGVSILGSPTDALSEQLEKDFRNPPRRGIEPLPETFYLLGHPGEITPEMSPEKQAEVVKRQERWEAQQNAFFEAVGAKFSDEGNLTWETRAGPQNFGERRVTMVASYEKIAALWGSGSRLDRVLTALGARGLIKNIMVDEAHRISDPTRESGRYMIESLRNYAPDAPLLMTSATLHEQARRNIAAYGGISEENITAVNPILDPEQRMGVYIPESRRRYGEAVTELAKRHGASFFVVPSIAEGEEYAAKLRLSGREAAMYHKDPTRPVSDPELAQQMIGYMGPNQTLLGTGAVGVGMNFMQLGLSAHVGVGTVNEIVQSSGRLRGPGEKALVANPSDFENRARKMLGTLAEIPGEFNELYDVARAIPSLSRNWKIAGQQITQSIQGRLREKQQYEYLASQVTSIMRESGLINLKRQVDPETDESYMGWSFADLTGVTPYDTAGRAQYKDPSDASKYVGFTDYMRSLEDVPKEYRATGKVLEQLGKVRDPYQRGDIFQQLIYERYYGLRPQLKGGSPGGHESLGLIMRSGRGESVMSVRSWTSPSSVEAYPTEIARAEIAAQLSGSEIVGTHQTQPTGARNADGGLASRQDYTLPGKTVISEDFGKTETVNPNTVRSNRIMAKGPEEWVAAGANDETARLVADKVFANLKDQMDALAEEVANTAKNFKSLDRPMVNFTERVSGIAQDTLKQFAAISSTGRPEPNAVAAFTSLMRGQVEAGNPVQAAVAGAIAQSFGGALAQASAPYIGTGGIEGGGGLVPSGGRGRAPGGGIFSSPAARALYGVYMARRMWQYTAAEAFQDIPYAASDDTALAAGVAAGSTYQGYLSRAAEARASSGRATLQIFGGFTDLQNAAMSVPSIARLTTAGRVGAGVAFGGIEMGLNIQGSGFFMTQMGMTDLQLAESMKAGAAQDAAMAAARARITSGQNLAALGMGMSKVAGAVGAGIFVAQAASEGANALFGLKGREEVQLGNIPRNIAMSWIAGIESIGHIGERGAGKTLGDLVKLQAGAFTSRISTDILSDVGVSQQELGRFGKLYDYAGFEGEGVVEKSIREAATRSARVGGGVSGDYTPLYTALGRGMPGGVSTNVASIEQMITRGQEYGVGAKELTQTFMTYAEQMGMRPESPAYAQAMSTFGGSYAQLVRDQERGVRTAMFAGQLQAYVSPTMAAQAVQGLDATQVRGLASLADMYQQYGGKPEGLTGGYRMAAPSRQLAGRGVAGRDAAWRAENWTDVMGDYEKQYGAIGMAAFGKAFFEPLAQAGMAPEAIMKAAPGIMSRFEGYTPQQWSLTTSILGGDMKAASWASWNQPGVLTNIGQGVDASRAFGPSGQPIYNYSTPDFMRFMAANAGTQAGRGFTDIASMMQPQTYFPGAPAGYSTRPGMSAAEAGRAYYSQAGITGGGLEAIAGAGYGSQPASFQALQYYTQDKLYQNALASVGVGFAGVSLSERYYWGTGTWNKPAAGSAWALEDQMRALQYRSQIADFGSQQRRMEMGQQFAVQQEGLSWQRMQTGFQYGTWQRGFEQAGAIQQRGWQREDWQYQDQTRSLQYGWGLEDINEQIRFSTGRERRLLVRQKERMTLTHGLEEGQIDRVRDRQETLWAREDERFKKQSEYAEKLKALDIAQYDLNKKQRESFYKLDVEDFERRMKEYKQEKEIRDEMLVLSRKYQYDQLQLQKASLGIQAENIKLQHELDVAARNTVPVWQLTVQELQDLVEYGGSAAKVIETLGSIMTTISHTNQNTLRLMIQLFREVDNVQVGD